MNSGFSTGYATFTASFGTSQQLSPYAGVLAPGLSLNSLKLRKEGSTKTWAQEPSGRVKNALWAAATSADLCRPPTNLSNSESSEHSPCPLRPK